MRKIMLVVRIAVVLSLILTSSCLVQLAGSEANLVGHWKFDEGGGTTAYDSSGYNNHGTLVNGPLWVDGKIGTALKFDAIDDYVNVGNDMSLNPSSEITISAWIKPDSFAGWGGWAGVIVARWSDGFEVDAYVFETNCNSSLRMWIRDVGDVFGGSLQIGKWQHVAVTYDGNYIKLYIDGVEVRRTSASGSLNSATQNTLIGSNKDNPGARFNGAIDDVRIYNIALPPSPSVGGTWVPVDKFSLLAPYIGLASTIIVATAATAIYVKRRNKK